MSQRSPASAAAAAHTAGVATSGAVIPPPSPSPLTPSAAPQALNPHTPPYHSSSPLALLPTSGLRPPPSSSPTLSLGGSSVAVPQYDFSSLSPAGQQFCTHLLNDCNLRRARHAYTDAIASFEKILSIVPSYVPGWIGKGLCYRALKDLVSAGSCFQLALELAPTDWAAHDHLGQTLKDSEMLEKAMEQFRLAIHFYNAQLTASGGKADKTLPSPCPAIEHLAIVLTDYGTRLKLAGQTDKAVAAYNEALTVSRSYYSAHFNLGVVYSERREFDTAMKHYQAAVEQNPNYVEALCNIGVIYKNSGDLAMAIEYYDRALKANPNFAIANSNYAIALTDMGTQVKNEGRLDEGIQYYKRALHHHSKYPAAWYNLGVAYAEKCRFDDAKVCYEMALLFDPKCAEAANNIGVIYKDRGNLDQAIHYYSLALQANPKFSQTMNNLAVIYTMLGKLDEAHDYCSKAIAANPLYSEALNNLGVLYRDEGRISEAISSYEECLKIDPLSRNAGQNRLLAMNSMIASALASSSSSGPSTSLSAKEQNGHQMTDTASTSSSSSASSTSSASSSTPDSGTTAAVSALTALGATVPVATSSAFEFRRIQEHVWDAHRAWGQQFAAQFERERYREWNYALVPSSGTSASPAAGALADAGEATRSQRHPLVPSFPLSPSLVHKRPLRIGYLSADFFTHSVSYFIEAPLTFADPARTFVTCYSNVARRDKKTAHLQTLAHAWRSVHDLNAKQVCELVRQDRIDILVELTGHTAGNRLDVMALKPAPIQVTWIGYPNCFDDSIEVLTERGFLGRDEIVRSVATSAKLRFAAFDARSQQLQYQPLAARDGLTLSEPGSWPMIDMCSQISDGEDNLQVQMSVTPNHDLYAAVAPSAKMGKLKASDLLHSQKDITVLSACAGGVQPFASSVDVFGRLGLVSTVQQHAFLELFGLVVATNTASALLDSVLPTLSPSVSLRADELVSSIHLPLHSLRSELANLCAAAPQDRVLPSWTLSSLDSTLACCLLRGLSSSSSFADMKMGSITVLSSLLRDQLLIVCLHAGFSAHWQPLPVEKAWRVSFSADNTLAKPTIRPYSAISTRTYVGRVWCVTVSHPDHLIVARRVQRDPSSMTVIAASRPMIIGNSTGLPTIDYRLTDAIADPVDTKQQYSEELVRLPGPFLCYTPPIEAPAVSPTPALQKGYITFGSFNNLAKLNDTVLQAWCTILKRVPRSRMLIKCKPFASPTVCGKLWRRFSELGIDSDRVDLVSLLPTTSEHLDSYSNVDIAIDTWPYAGTTTTCEALYCGVPVVTFQRVDCPSHAHNVGATLLSRIPSLQPLIAKSVEEYIRVAVSLAQDVHHLQSMRQTLRAAMMASPLCDGKAFVETLSTTYATMWQRCCQQQSRKAAHGDGGRDVNDTSMAT